jgi:hypothetical protein
MPLNIAAFAKPHSQDLQRQRQPQQQRNGKGFTLCRVDEFHSVLQCR